MTPRRVLVVGAGGREHALAWRLARDPAPAEVLATPGHPGMEGCARALGIGELDAPALVEACRREEVALAVIGPEAPLAAGVSDALAAAGVTVFGASRAAARLESSKWFAKEVMREAGVPTARAALFEDLPAATRALASFGPPWVIKADGLAAGKGVRVTTARAEAEAFLAECLEAGRFGAGGRRVLLEEHLAGEEASVMAVCDGREHVLLPAARDFKRAWDGDRGPNTGGMGAYAPAAAVGEEARRAISERIVAPVLAAMAARGTPFRGLLYCGLMLGADGARVVEFNARFGDPEAQVVLPLLEGDVGALLASAARGALAPEAARAGEGAVVAVALVDEGYPDAVRGGGTLVGLDRLARRADVMVFHAGDAPGPDGWTVRGGRAAYVAVRAATRAEARRRVYDAIATLTGTGWRVRHDIAAGDGAVSSAKGGADGGTP